MKTTDLEEIYGRYGNRDSYQRDYDSSRTGFGRQHREIDDEANLMYVYKDGRVKQRMISNHEERSAHQEGFRQTPEDALRLHGIVRSKYHHGKWIQNQGGKWLEVHPFGKPESDVDRNIEPEPSGIPKKNEFEIKEPSDLDESATAGATSAANIGTVVSPHLAIGRRNIGNKSYTGSPGKSGTKAPKLPKIVQPKNKDGTAKNALDIKGSSLFGGPLQSKAKTKNKKH
jgi:hypothetical protein